MNKNKFHKVRRQFVTALIPFLGIGIFLVLLIAGVVIFSWILILGAAVGLLLFAIFWVYNKLFVRDIPTKGRTIDHEDKNDPPNF